MKNRLYTLGIRNYFVLMIASFFLLPFLANAATPPSVTITSFIGQVAVIINTIIPFLVGLAVFIIIYGILGYISSAADEEKRQQARQFITWGVIGVFMMLSVWGLVTILINSFNLDRSTTVVTTIYGAPQGVPGGAPATVVDLINRINTIGTNVIPFLIGIGVFIIILGIINYIRQGDNEEKRAEGRRFIVWGVISVFMMLSIWGFVNILVNSFQLNNVAPTIPNLPTLPTTPLSTP